VFTAVTDAAQGAVEAFERERAHPITRAVLRAGRQGVDEEIGPGGTWADKTLNGFSVCPAIRLASSSSLMDGRTTVAIYPRLVVLLFGVRFNGPTIHGAQRLARDIKNALLVRRRPMGVRTCKRVIWRATSRRCASSGSARRKGSIWSYSRDIFMRVIVF